eukprot:tig00021684_g23107.t1
MRVPCRSPQACHEQWETCVLHHEAPANELFTRLRMKPELAEKYGTGRAAENSFQALKQVAAVLEQMGSKSDVLTHRMLNGGNDSGEEYPEVDELGATAYRRTTRKVQQPNGAGQLVDVDIDVEAVRTPRTDTSTR